MYINTICPNVHIVLQYFWDSVALFAALLKNFILKCIKLIHKAFPLIPPDSSSYLCQCYLWNSRGDMYQDNKSWEASAARKGKRLEVPWTPPAGSAASGGDCTLTRASGVPCTLSWPVQWLQVTHSDWDRLDFNTYFIRELLLYICWYHNVLFHVSNHLSRS